MQTSTNELPNSSAILALRERLMKLEELKSLMQEQARRTARRKLLTYFPDTGPLRRELYQKHLEFFAAGPNYRERLMLAANRVGKCITIGSYVETCSGRKTVGQLISENQSFEVWAWSGTERVKAFASAPFRKRGRGASGR